MVTEKFPAALFGVVLSVGRKKAADLTVLPLTTLKFLRESALRLKTTV
jgi:hypothetical protein